MPTLMALFYKNKTDLKVSMHLMKLSELGKKNTLRRQCLSMASGTCLMLALVPDIYLSFEHVDILMLSWSE